MEIYWGSLLLNFLYIQTGFYFQSTNNYHTRVTKDEREIENGKRYFHSTPTIIDSPIMFLDIPLHSY